MRKPRFFGARVGILGGLVAIALAQVDGDLTEPIARAAPPKTPTIKPELKKLVATRPVYNAQLMKQRLVTKHGVTSLKVLLANGKRVDRVLESTSGDQPSAGVLKVANTLPKELAPYKAHFNREWVSSAKLATLKFPPSDVNRRSSQTSVKDQGTRGTCSAFAALAALESFLWKKHARAFDLSENDAYHVFMESSGGTCPADQGIPARMGAEYLVSHHICGESQFPYVGVPPSSDVNHVPTSCSDDAPYGISSYQEIFGTELGGGQYINANNTNYLEAMLASGHDIAYQLAVAGTAWTDNTANTGTIDVQRVGNDPAPSVGHHILLLVGYHRDSADQNKSYFIFKNSWGSHVGHAGYFYVSYTYIQVYGYEGFYIKSAPAPPAGAGSASLTIPKPGSGATMILDGGIGPGIQAPDGG